MMRIFKLCFALIFILSCKKDVSDAHVMKELIAGVDTLTGNITVNTTIITTTVIKGVVVVKSGVTLTILPGVTMLGSSGIAEIPSSKGFLVIEKGAKLSANGTSSDPIIWTSDRPAGSKRIGDWGGIFILGESNTKGLDPFIINYHLQGGNTPTIFTWGGNKRDDNSGSLAYNRIEFSTVGLSLYAVGNGTILHHIEISNTSNNAFNFEGGSVNGHHLLSFRNQGNDYIFSYGYQGKLQFIIAYRTDIAAAPFGPYMINVEDFRYGNQYPPDTLYTKPFIVNASLIGPVQPSLATNANNHGAIVTKGAARLWLANSVIIAQSLSKVLCNTPSNFDAYLNPGNPYPTYIRNNIWQFYNEVPVWNWADDRFLSSGAYDRRVVKFLADSTNNNSYLPSLGSFGLNDFLVPQPNSPVLSGGLDLSGYGFLGTVQRGAVILSDSWTTENWIATVVH